MDIKKIKEQIVKELNSAKNAADLDNLWHKYLGRKGEITLILRSLKDLAEKERKAIGHKANLLKKDLEEIFEEKKAHLSDSKAEKGKIDITAPGRRIKRGHKHPLSVVLEEIVEIFNFMGFETVEGPEIETEHYNFDALNIPADHPARDLWDTFWLKGGGLLRTHTSPVQIRHMEKNKPPFKIIAPGRCFRHEATDVSHDVQFYQVEGLMVGENISVRNLKGVMEEFFKRFFKAKDIEMRLRPSYFPFVEPGFEIDIKFKGKWMEIMGAGMVHPNVFKAVGLDFKSYQGFAFGLGVERLAKIKFKIDDIRLFYSNDLRILKQF